MPIFQVKAKNSYLNMKENVVIKSLKLPHKLTWNNVVNSANRKWKSSLERWSLVSGPVSYGVDRSVVSSVIIYVP
jgi:hypothetical protein